MTTWLFTRDPAGFFHALAVTELDGFLQGGRPLPSRVNPDGFIYVVDVFVEMTNRVPSTARVYTCWRVPAKADGRLDVEHHQADMLALVTVALPLSGSAQAEEDVIGEEAFAERRFRQTRFNLSTADEHRLREAVNKKAKRRVM